VPPLIFLPLWYRRWRIFYGIALGLVLTLVVIAVVRLGAALVGCAMLLTLGAVVGFRRQRSSGELPIITGILIGLVFVVCPTVHNFYYLLLMPLLAGLIYQYLNESPEHRLNRGILVALVFFF